MAKKLEIADWCEIQRILRETYEIWSPGLSRDSYRDFVFKQMGHPWCRSNYQYLILRDEKNSKTPAASLKYYLLTLNYRGRSLKFAGFGAIYTRKDLRGYGYATELIKLSLDRAWYDGCHGTILFSDIAPAFYADFGFFDLNNEKFVLSLKKKTTADKTRASETSSSAGGGTPRIMKDTKEYILKSNLGLESGDTLFKGELDPYNWSTDFIVEDDIVIHCRYLTTSPDQIDFVTRHYGRWLRRQSFGFERSSLYFHFKTMRENYLARHSTLSWPRLELLTIDNQQSAGYAIIEYGGRVVRILELIGDDNARRLLWKGVIARAHELEAIRISGWESVLTDLRPGFTINQFATIDTTMSEDLESLGFAEKQKGRTMILPFKEELEEWLTVCPCPVLEFDHI